jgi:DNA-binding transcriptional regulator YiaG
MSEPMSTEELLILGRARRLAKSGEARAMRERAGLRQGLVAQSIGMHQSRLNHWEAGRRMPHGPAGVRYGRLLDALAEDTK